jgi:hypothetical protein
MEMKVSEVRPVGAGDVAVGLSMGVTGCPVGFGSGVGEGTGNDTSPQPIRLAAARAENGGRRLRASPDNRSRPCCAARRLAARAVPPSICSTL